MFKSAVHNSQNRSMTGRCDKMSVNAIGTAIDKIPCVIPSNTLVIPSAVEESENEYKFKIHKTMIKPLADRVVIEPKEAETKTASGLYIPDTAKEKPQQGIVAAAGPGKKDEAMEVKVGDVVLYGKYAGTEVTVDGKKYLIVRQSDILAIL